MSRESRERLIAELVEAVRMHQNAVDAVDDAATRYLGLNRTDARCLDIVERRGGVTAGELATESGLTTGAITAALDRLERAGYVRRVRDTADRRRVLVALTDKANRCAMECYGPIAKEGYLSLQPYSEGELTLIRDFMRSENRLLTGHALRLQSMAGREPEQDPQESTIY